MKTGVIKFFNRKKGFGFIIVDDTEEQIYFHATGVGRDKRILKQGDKVTFEMSETEKGPSAVEIQRAED